MDDTIVVSDGEDSDASVVEVSVAPKTPPPLIDIDFDDELVLNISQPIVTSVVKHVAMKDTPLECGGSGEAETTELAEASETSELADKAISPSHWTAAMRRYYNDDWGDEAGFVVEVLQSRMDPSTALWATLGGKRRGPQAHARCFNCMAKGHLSRDCPEPVRVHRCHMCGEAGHRFTECHNTKCLCCGDRTSKFWTSCKKCSPDLGRQCTRCDLRGHRFVDCTDNWRRYHLTTSLEGGLRVPRGRLDKPAAQQWCCNCGSRGHNYIGCREERDRSFPLTNPYVRSYYTAFNGPAEADPAGPGPDPALDNVLPLEQGDPPVDLFLNPAHASQQGRLRYFQMDDAAKEKSGEGEGLWTPQGKKRPRDERGERGSSSGSRRRKKRRTAEEHDNRSHSAHSGSQAKHDSGPGTRPCNGETRGRMWKRRAYASPATGLVVPAKDRRRQQQQRNRKKRKMCQDIARDSWGSQVQV